MSDVWPFILFWIFRFFISSAVLSTSCWNCFTLLSYVSLARFRFNSSCCFFTSVNAVFAVFSCAVVFSAFACAP